MRSPALRLLALLALVLATNAQQRREQAVQQQEPGAALAAAAADAPGAAAAPQQPHDPQRALGSIGWEEAAKPRGGVPGSLRLGTTAPAPAQPHSPEALAAAALFLHPLTPPNKRHDRDVAEQAHADMQQWLKGFFAEASSASRLTSTRLQAARVALPPPPPPAAVPPPANATDTPANITAAATNSTASPPPKPEPPRTDVLEAAGEQPCNATCARAAAERLLLRGEQPGQRALQLRWPQFPEDPRRWAARPHANGTCLPRQPREALSRDYLLVAAVGNNLSAVDRQVPIGWLARWRASWLAACCWYCPRCGCRRGRSTAAEPQRLLQTHWTPSRLLAAASAASAGGWTSPTPPPLTWCCCTTATPRSCAARAARLCCARRGPSGS